MSDNNNIMEKIPSPIILLLKDLEAMKLKIEENKKHNLEMCKVFMSMEKKITKILNKEVKKSIKKRNKPRGINIPNLVSPELCRFLKISPDTKISRTEITRFLMAYIKENQLFNMEKKSIIIPDENLLSILDIDAEGGDDDIKLTRFTIQKYLNKHFIHNQQNKRDMVDGGELNVN